MGLSFVTASYPIAGVCGNERYSTKNTHTKWHPNSNGAHYQADIFAYYFLTTIIKYLEKNQNSFNTLINNNQIFKLNEILTGESGNWQTDILKQRYEWPMDTQTAKQLQSQSETEQQTLSQKKPDPTQLWCLPYCQNVPFTLLGWRPLVWNSGSRLIDYLDTKENRFYFYNKDNNKYSMFHEKESNFDSLKAKFGARWKWEYYGVWNLDETTGWTMELHPAFDLMDGFPGPCDTKGQLTPNEKFHVQVKAH